VKLLTEDVGAMVAAAWQVALPLSPLHVPDPESFAMAVAVAVPRPATLLPTVVHVPVESVAVSR
jgi:hypothetical protein